MLHSYICICTIHVCSGYWHKTVVSMVITAAYLTSHLNHSLMVIKNTYSMKHIFFSKKTNQKLEMNTKKNTNWKLIFRKMNHMMRWMINHKLLPISLRNFFTTTVCSLNFYRTFYFNWSQMTEELWRVSSRENGSPILPRTEQEEHFLLRILR